MKKAQNFSQIIHIKIKFNLLIEFFTRNNNFLNSIYLISNSNRISIITYEKMKKKNHKIEFD